MLFKYLEEYVTAYEQLVTKFENLNKNLDSALEDEPDAKPAEDSFFAAFATAGEA